MIRQSVRSAVELLSNPQELGNESQETLEFLADLFCRDCDRSTGYDCDAHADEDQMSEVQTKVITDSKENGEN